MIEKENKKLRDDARREYNDTVRALAQYVRKRDPRYKAHLADQATKIPPEKQKQNETQHTRRFAPELSSVFLEQEWQKASSSAFDDDLAWAAGEGDDDETWECVACGKSFRSEAAWDSHERSKKHMKAVEELKLLMRLEEDELGLGDKLDTEPEATNHVEPSVIQPPAMGAQVAADEGPPTSPSPPTAKQPNKTNRSATMAQERLTKTERLAANLSLGLDSSTLELSPEDGDNASKKELTKKEKRRLKDATKKADQTSEPVHVSTFQCLCSFSIIFTVCT